MASVELDVHVQLLGLTYSDASLIAESLVISANYNREEWSKEKVAQAEGLSNMINNMLAASVENTQSHF